MQERTGMRAANNDAIQIEHGPFLAHKEALMEWASAHRITGEPRSKRSKVAGLLVPISVVLA